MINNTYIYQNYPKPEFPDEGDTGKEIYNPNKKEHENDPQAAFVSVMKAEMMNEVGALLPPVINHLFPKNDGGKAEDQPWQKFKYYKDTGKFEITMKKDYITDVKHEGKFEKMCKGSTAKVEKVVKGRFNSKEKSIEFESGISATQTMAYIPISASLKKVKANGDTFEITAKKGFFSPTSNVDINVVLDFQLDWK